MFARISSWVGILTRFDQLDRSLSGWMARTGVVLLRISLGIVFFWFWVLKFFPNLSPAQDLATIN